ncbi:MAG: 1-acyl-sn-glycerol-3-phosphate acyltransferase [Cyanobacteria bacterium J06597_16]
MPSVTNRAQPALDFVPPQYSPLLKRAMRSLMPVWTAWQTDISDVETRNVETLVNLYQDFERGKTRFLIAFRHPNPTDPYVLGHLLWRSLPYTAREMGISLKRPHSHFIYDRGIPLWAGSYLSWVFSRLGGIPIQRGKLDLLALKTARRLFVDGDFPLAAAPEGGNNGHNEIVSPLEPGIAQLSFWCAEDLQAKDRAESVVILPVGIQYRYLEAPWRQLDKLIGKLEVDSGLGLFASDDLDAARRRFDGEAALLNASVTGISPDVLFSLYVRLYRLAAHLLTLMEGYYQTFYGVSFEKPEDAQGPNAQLAERLRSLIDEALKVAENYFNIRPRGSMIDRCRKLEQAGWDRIFREDTASLSAVELGLANRVAEEADLRMWHMRLVESFVAVTGHYVKENPSADRFAETTLLLSDMVAKIKGEASATRPYLGEQKAIVTVGSPIEVTPRLADYKAKRRGAIASLTKDLQDELESLILM